MSIVYLELVTYANHGSYAIIALAFYIYPDNVQGDPTGNGLAQQFFATS